MKESYNKMMKEYSSNDIENKPCGEKCYLTNNKNLTDKEVKAKIFLQINIFSWFLMIS